MIGHTEILVLLPTYFFSFLVESCKLLLFLWQIVLVYLQGTDDLIDFA